MVAKVKYEEMLPHEVLAARTARPVAYLPVGTLEWHGKHNAVGLDTLKARALCVRAAETFGGLAMPPLWWGEQRETQLVEVIEKEGVGEHMGWDPEAMREGFMGKSTDETTDAYHNLLDHILHQLQSLQFHAVVVICGHYPLQGYARHAAERFMASNPMRVYGATEADLIKDLGDELGGRVGDHAGRFETSLMQVLVPGSVDLAQLPRLDEVPPTLQENFKGERETGDPSQFIGVAGEDPRLASKEFGERVALAIIQRMHDKADELLAEYRHRVGQGKL